MTDNVAITAGAGTTIATDEVGGFHHQRVKLVWGADGTVNDADTASGKPIPSQLRHSDGTSISDATGIKISTTQLATSYTSQQLFSTGAQGVFLPSDHPAVPAGYKATTALSALTLVADAAATPGYAGLDGVQITRPHCNLEDLISGVLANTDGTSTAVIAAQAAGIRSYITSVIIANTSATAVTVDLRDGAAGTVKATFPVPANTSGVVCNLPVPLRFSAATAVCMDASAAASTVTCTLIGFKSKV